MSDINIRVEGRAGRITLNRPDALNALTYEMCLDIEAALDQWRGDDEVSLVIIDASGDKAFCAGGDIVEMYRTASSGDFEYGRKFWRDEYRLNAKIFEYPKPYVAFMHGFTMGGGVGVSCHGSHRIVGETSRIAMPECGIGLVPDVGGSLMLALAPGHLGEYLGTTGARMGPDDAIYAGFADHFMPESVWEDAKQALVETGDADAVLSEFATDPPTGSLRGMQSQIDAYFRFDTLGDIFRAIDSEPNDFTATVLKALDRVSPLSAAAAIQVVHRVRGVDSIRRALEIEYRYTYRSAEEGDFVEGIRALVIDKDKTPKWRHPDIQKVPDLDVAHMLMPLGENKLTFGGGSP